MALPASGPLSMAQIHAEFGRGYDLNSYRGTQWYINTTPGNFPYTPISFSDFFSKQPNSSDPYIYTAADEVNFDGSGVAYDGMFFGIGAAVVDTTYFRVVYGDSNRHHTNLQISIDGVIGRTQMGWSTFNWWEIYVPAGGYGFANTARTIRLYATDVY